MHWQNKFTFPNAAANPTIAAVAARTAVNVGHTIAGPINDGRFTTVMTTPQAINCNAIAATAEQRPNLVEAQEWSPFDVARWRLPFWHSAARHSPRTRVRCGLN